MQTLSNSWLPRKPKFWQFSITQKHINFITAKSLATVSWWEINVKDEQGKTSTTLKERYLAELYRSNTLKLNFCCKVNFIVLVLILKHSVGMCHYHIIK